MTLVLGANHWAKAIETHALNFPNADHLIAGFAATGGVARGADLIEQRVLGNAASFSSSASASS